MEMFLHRQVMEVEFLLSSFPRSHLSGDDLALLSVLCQPFQKL